MNESEQSRAYLLSGIPRADVVGQVGAAAEDVRLRRKRRTDSRVLILWRDSHVGGRDSRMHRLLKIIGPVRAADAPQANSRTTGELAVSRYS